MRTRLTRTERRKAILDTARRLFTERGLAGTEMEDIRQSCGISRGGLYHHFQNKRAVLDGIVEGEVAKLVDALEGGQASPIPSLLRAGSSHLGNGPGFLSSLNTEAEKLDYLSSLEHAYTALLRDPLSDRLKSFVRPDVDPEHLAELFLTINAHINRREILGHWKSAEAAGFAATALEALAPLLDAPSDIEPFVLELKEKAKT